MLADLLLKLQNEAISPGDGRVHRFEDILAQIGARNDPACIALLLPFFSDDAEHDELMFSIIHTIERFDDFTYVRAVVDHLESFFLASPRWAVIVHMRIFNSPATSAAYEDYIKTLQQEKLAVVRNVLEAVRTKSAKFATRCDSLLAAIYELTRRYERLRGWRDE